ncbi:MAG TPA: hypothetical protein VK402_19640 [Blastococcus sp.]|nr:hypothetical protein [Blastococcus sp.]
MTQRRRLATPLVVAPLLPSAGCTGGDEEPKATDSTTPSLTTTRGSTPSSGATPSDENPPQNQVRVSPGPIAEARTTGFFEGTREVLIGMRGGEAPFRAFGLTDPGRIVSDVRG